MVVRWQDFTLLVRTFFHQMEGIESFCLRYDEIVRSVVGGHDIPEPSGQSPKNKDEFDADADWTRPVRGVGAANNSSGLGQNGLGKNGLAFEMS
jgi:hypothetical protein